MYRESGWTVVPRTAKNHDIDRQCTCVANMHIHMTTQKNPQAQAGSCGNKERRKERTVGERKCTAPALSSHSHRPFHHPFHVPSKSCPARRFDVRYRRRRGEVGGDDHDDDEFEDRWVGGYRAGRDMYLACVLVNGVGFGWRWTASSRAAKTSGADVDVGGAGTLDEAFGLWHASALLVLLSRL